MLYRQAVGPIAGSVSPNENDPSIRTLRQHLRKRTHETVIPSIRLQIARDEGNQLVLRADHMRTDRDVPRKYAGIWRAELQIDPLAQKADLLMRPTRISAPLKEGRCLPVLVQVQRKKINGVLDSDIGKKILPRWKFRIEIDVISVGMIEKLEIPKDRRVRIDVDNIEQLTPAVMPDDDIRGVAEPLQRLSGTGDSLGTAQTHLELSQGGMGLGRNAPFLTIKNTPYARQRPFIGL